MKPTVFHQILEGTQPCHRVYEDAHVLAFLDIHPLSQGHLLVIPKEPAETLDQLSDDAAAALGRVLPRLCRALLKVTQAPAYHIIQNNGRLANQSIPYVHVHIIPKPKDETLSGLRVTWEPAPNVDDAANAQLVKEMTAFLEA